MLSPLATTMPNKTIFTDAIMVNANCLDALKKMNDNSVSAIIIDPPYGTLELRRTDKTCGTLHGRLSSGRISLSSASVCL